MSVRCDGCDEPYDTSQIAFYMARGHMMRYCPSCKDQYDALKHAIDAECTRYQHLLNIFSEEARKKVSLKITPLDLPILALTPDGAPVVLK